MVNSIDMSLADFVWYMSVSCGNIQIDKIIPPMNPKASVNVIMLIQRKKKKNNKNSKGNYY